MGGGGGVFHILKIFAPHIFSLRCQIHIFHILKFSYIKNILHLDFGQSLSTQEPVLNIILKSLPASLELGFFSILSAILIGFSLGLIGLKNRGKKTDYISRILGITTYAIPPFWGAMLAQLLFSVFFNISPIGGRFPIFQQQP